MVGTAYQFRVRDTHGADFDSLQRGMLVRVLRAIRTDAGICGEVRQGVGICGVLPNMSHTRAR